MTNPETVPAGGCNQGWVIQSHCLASHFITSHSHAMRADHITPVLKDLHWLRIQERIQYKLCVLAFKCQHNLASRSNRAQTPSEIIKFTSARRTSDQKCRHGLGDRAFLVAAASYGMEQSAVNSHCCVNPAFIPSSPEISSIHRICILVTFLS